ncbi:hypothetical protein M407DRAFT_17313 [Tulasnella calospora MUT 4182]|uniref:Membrane-associated protein n=1 Tax=Tulasnella calospora MUT 4182 TaxID=1051891 RepID=A0A0C3QWA2_9AGAM|nr:hypothetical protein M407DRAFT_17313 [Tulasnella calospora MUT 4182]
MLRQPSLLLSLLIALFVSISSVWAKNVTVLMDDKRLTFSDVSTTLTNDWEFDQTGLCLDDGGYSRTYTKGAWVRLRFNGTAAYVAFAECSLGAPTNVTIDDAQATVEALNMTLSLSSRDCQTRTLFATNLTNTNHTITVAYAGTGTSGQTVLNKFIYDDGDDTPIADPTATRATVTISDTGASSSSATPSASAAASEDSSGCGTGCKTASISGTVGTILALLFWFWCFRACCCSRTRTEVNTVIVRPPSPKPQPIILLAATLEVQQTHIQVNRVERDSAVVAAPPAYAGEQNNYK